MASVSSSNAFVLLQLSLLLCTSMSQPHYPPTHAPHPHPHHHHNHSPAEAPHHHHHHAPTPAPTPTPTPYPPVKPPTHPPIKPPAHPPVKPPAHPPVKPPSYPLPQRKKVAVRGMVYCKSCKYRGEDTLTDAVTLAGATVKLQCNNTRVPRQQEIKTDSKGFFFFMPDFLTTFAFHKCKVFLVSSPLHNCTVPTNLHGGANGAVLIPAVMPPVSPKQPELDFALFTVGPFAFDAHKRLPCH